MISNFINKYSDLAAWKADQNRDYPNIAYLEQEDMVKWTPVKPETRVFCTYNVTTTSSPTKLLLVTTNITKMYIDDAEQPSVVTGYTFSTTGEHTVKYEMGNSLVQGVFNGCTVMTDAIIPDTITSIGNYAFYDCRGLTGVTIPDSVTSIGMQAFNYCSTLPSIIIPDSVESIGASGFTYDNRLATVSIGSGVASIGRSAFYGCRGLTSITVEATTPPSLGADAFDYTNNTFIIYVPAESVNAYKTASGWSTYASRIQAIQ
jgi:hypothetical protein